jgi:hypothetical protein
MVSAGEIRTLVASLVTVGLCAGGTAAYATLQKDALPDVSGIPAVSPVPYASKSIAAGKATFLRMCAECHDEDGKALAQMLRDDLDRSVAEPGPLAGIWQEPLALWTEEGTLRVAHRKFIGTRQTHRSFLGIDRRKNGCQAHRRKQVLCHSIPRHNIMD